jgi:hypothetical protein
MARESTAGHGAAGLQAGSNRLREGQGAGRVHAAMAALLAAQGLGARTGTQQHDRG